MEIYYEEDKKGKHKVFKKKNGVTVRILREPSEEHKLKMAKKAEKQRLKQEEEQAKLEKERLIKSKMRELAIKELEAEGKL